MNTTINLAHLHVSHMEEKCLVNTFFAYFVNQVKTARLNPARMEGPVVTVVRGTSVSALQDGQDTSVNRVSSLYHEVDKAPL